MPLAAVLVAASCWLAPVDAPVVDPFRPPSCAWCPGNRGLEFGTSAGIPVRSVAAGVVTFAGPVAGTTYVVVELTDGQRVTYGGLAPPTASSPTVGDAVAAGQVVGVTAGRLHVGLRVRAGDGDLGYVDPAPWLGAAVGRPRLVPVDGTAARPAPPPRWRCAALHGPRARPSDQE